MTQLLNPPLIGDPPIRRMVPLLEHLRQRGHRCRLPLADLLSPASRAIRCFAKLLTAHLSTPSKASRALIRLPHSPRAIVVSLVPTPRTLPDDVTYWHPFDRTRALIQHTPLSTASWSVNHRSQRLQSYGSRRRLRAGMGRIRFGVPAQVQVRLKHSSQQRGCYAWIKGDDIIGGQYSLAVLQ